MEDQFVRRAVLLTFLMTLTIVFCLLWRLVVGDFESDNNFNRYDIKVITDPKTGCEYLIQDRNRVGELLPRYDDNGKIKGCKSE